MASRVTRISFTKMHGLGNDFVIVDGRYDPVPRLSQSARIGLADRHTGIGCDQLILLEPSETADLQMRIFNPDGEEVGACGNAARAVGLLAGEPVRIETAGGIIHAEPNERGIAVDMGEPRFGWEDVPLAYAMDTLLMPVGWKELQNPAAVNVGNPHVVFFLEDVEAVPLHHLGPLIERDPLFPERVNVNVAQATGPNSLKLRVWERGAGLTRACGTGACASAVAALRRRFVTSPVNVSLPGGDLEVAWNGSGPVTMRGPAAESFRGSFELEAYG